MIKINPSAVESRFVSNLTEGHFAKYTDVPSTRISGVLMPKAPFVSIVIPTFRRPDLLKETIESALAQDCPGGFEVIVVDNDAEAGPDDPTEAMIRSIGDPRLVHFRNDRNIGQEGNFNRTIDIARGHWFCQLHDDDWIAPDYLARMTRNIPEGAEFLAGRILIGEDSYRPDYPWPSRDDRTRPRRLTQLDALHSFIPVAPALISRDAAIAVGGFDGSLYPVLDYDFLVALIRRGKAWLVPEHLSYYRTVDSVTFKGDTFERQIRGTIRVKRDLMAHTPAPLAQLYYLETMRRQFDRVREIDKDPGEYLTGRLERIADWMSRHRAVGEAYGKMMYLVRGAVIAGGRFLSPSR